ncbi:MAG: FliM/FliN family flagellar motor switch protein [Verrucomicrobium sp.]|nr:FliM/FliN family flagellar motor switch protein [Verrucomicrobium sp.]
MAQDSSGDVLSQAEVEAILASVQSGVDPGATVISAGTEKRRPSEGQKSHHIQPYDFRSPVFLTPAQMRRLRIKHEEFIRNLSAALSVFLRMEFLLQMSRLETTTYKQLIESMGMPSYLTLFRMKPLPGIAVLDLTPRLGLTIIDRMLGGPGHSVKVEREFTDMEQTVLENFIQLIIKEYTESWIRFQKLEWEKVGNENTIRFLDIAEPDQTMLYLEMEARFGDCVSTLRFVFCYETLETLVDQMMHEMSDGDDGKESEVSPSFEPNAPTYNIQIPLTAYWRGFSLSLEDISGLSPGDVLMLDPDKVSHVEVDLGALPKFQASLDRKGKQVSIQLTNKIEG